MATTSFNLPMTILPAFTSIVSCFSPSQHAVMLSQRRGNPLFMANNISTGALCSRRLMGIEALAAGMSSPALEAEKGQRVSKWHGEEWWDLEKEPVSEEEESRLAEELEGLEEEAMSRDLGREGREASDYHRRAHIFDRSARVFPAIKARRSPNSPTQSMSS